MRSYAIKSLYRMLCVLAVAILVSVVLAGFHSTFNGRDPVSIAWPLLILLLAVLSTLLIVSMFRTRIYLTGDTIEHFDGIIKRRRLRRDQIAGQRRLSVKGIPYLELIPHSGTAKKIQLTWLYETDQALMSWLASIPDLDVLEGKEAEARFLEDPRVGATPEERLARVKHARQLAGWFQLATVAIVCWGFTRPQPYWLAVGSVVALPVIALLIFIRFRGIIAIRNRSTPGVPNIIGAMIMPPVVLAFRASFDTTLLDWTSILPVIFAVASIVIVYLLWLNRDWRKPSAILIVVFLTILYVGGIAIIADVKLDVSVPASFRADVLGKHAEKGKYARFLLSLGPWGPSNGPDDVVVSREVYEELSPGGTACVALHPGLLGMKWYVVGACH